MASTPTVLFNVGGVKHEVAKSLIELYPDTMLARLVSEPWQKKTKNEDEAIFIDRDGERFRCVLDYMRDLKVHLPPNTSRGAMLQEFEYFGFENIASEAIIPTGVSREDVSECLETYHAELSKAKGDQPLACFKEWLNVVEEAERLLDKKGDILLKAFDREVLQAEETKLDEASAADEHMLGKSVGNAHLAELCFVKYLRARNCPCRVSDDEYYGEEVVRDDLNQHLGFFGLKCINAYEEMDHYIIDRYIIEMRQLRD